MDIFESILIALTSLKANKLRSGLTILGVIIGVAAVITMIAVGEGAKSQVTESIKNLGTNLLMVYPGQFRRGPGREGPRKDLKIEDAETIKEKVSSISDVTPEIRRSAKVEFENMNTTTSITGTTPSFLKVRNYQLTKGRNFSEEDLKGKKKVCILGAEVVKNLFGEYDPIGKIVKIARHNFEVIGTLKEKGTQMMGNPDDVIFIPLTTAQRRIFGKDILSTIYVQVKDEKLIDIAQEEITYIMRERHNLKEDDEDDFTVGSQKDMLQTMQSVLGTFTMLLASIAVVSLVVGGIGIMNIMLVSVVERTREIGIRKALGATPYNIMSQFIIEAIILSLIGGIIGIILGIIATKIIAKVAGWITVITFQSILLAFFFSVSVGIFFGFYPAKKASSLNPIDALRYE
jgi:putative ABC transport system permease protein